MMRIMLFCALTAACGDQLEVRTGVACESDTDCQLGDVTGSCQSSGFCAYTDDTCADGLRYPSGAGVMAGQCIGGDACGASDGAPCCGGTTCGANLVCNAELACACGGAAEPCCDGSTCDSGFSCAQGTCTGGVEQVSMGYASTCVLRSGGTVTCWGSDARRYFKSTPGSAVNLTTFGQVAISDVVEVRRGDYHACARKTDGTVWCWGHNEQGQLGNGSTTSSPTPVQVTGLTATQISAGHQHSCAIGSVNGTAGIYCWGHNRSGSNTSAQNGRLGNGTTTDSNIPVAVDMSMMAASGQTARHVVAGGYHSCAVMSDNRAWCWGNNSSGALGDNTNTSSSVPVLVDLSQTSIPTGVTIDEIVIGWRRGAGNSYSAMRLSNGVVYPWGNGTSRPEAPIDTSALGAATFTQLVTNHDGFCARASDGTVWCWGSGQQGATGQNDPDEDFQPEPIQVMGLPAGITSIGGGHRNACAADGAKRLWCWGNNRRGQLTRTKPSTYEEGRLLQAVDVTP